MSRWKLAGVALAIGVSTFQGTPIVRGTTVTFIAAGDASDPPRIVADFNAWEGGVMTPVGDGRTYSLEVTLDPAARIEYLVAYKDRFVLDPGNPRRVPAPAGPPRSELRMPGYRPPTELPPPRRRGAIQEIAFVSSHGESRRIRVYVPAVPRREQWPALYVHDGHIFVEALGVPSTLDSLIDTRRIPPLLVVFIDAVDRHRDYAPGSSFRSVFVSEIVSLIERRYGVARDRRALMGVSRSTLGALDACVNGSIAFETCALLAPAIGPKDFEAVLPARGSSLRVLIETGTYDLPLVTDVRALRRELERRAVSVSYMETPQGHNHTAFRSRLPAMMERLFRPESSRERRR